MEIRGNGTARILIGTTGTGTNGNFKFI